jgi:serine/threonine protein kinase
MATTLVRVIKVGEGTYGHVYKAKQFSPPSVKGISDKKSSDTDPKADDIYVAVKRNFKDLDASWLGNLRELDMLARLKGHPFIIDLINVSFGNPFGRVHPMTPIDEQKQKAKDDKVHFIMEYVEYSGERFFRDKKMCDPMTGKTLACQLLLAVEFMHSKGVTHRDLKPPNILISVDKKEGPRLRLCDFGLSQVLCLGEPSTPGVSTSWYRPPDVCCGSVKYGQELDMWAVGCILMEIPGSKAFLNNVKDSDGDAFNAILGRMPTHPSKDTINALYAFGNKPAIKPSASPIRRKSFLERMEVSTGYLREFNETKGSMDQFINLLTAILQLEPSKRLTATKALEHPFFDYFRSYIKEVRELYPPIPSPLPVLKIRKCSERQWMVATAFGLYNMRAKLEWYKDRVMFHAMDLFDRYLEWAFAVERRSRFPLGVMETAHTGRLHTRPEAELRFYVCLYLMHKYYASMSYPVEWKKFAPAVYSKPDQEIIAEQFEILLTEEVVEFRIYRDTLLEMPDEYHHQVESDLVNYLMLSYGQLDEWNDGSVRALYRKIMDIKV